MRIVDSRQVSCALIAARERLPSLPAPFLVTMASEVMSGKLLADRGDEEAGRRGRRAWWSWVASPGAPVTRSRVAGLACAQWNWYYSDPSRSGWRGAAAGTGLTGGSERVTMRVCAAHEIVCGRCLTSEGLRRSWVMDLSSSSPGWAAARSTHAGGDDWRLHCL